MKNLFKYQCAECGWTGFFHLNEFVRRCRPRCQGCGSTMLDPVTSEAQDRIATHDGEEKINHALMNAKTGRDKKGLL